MPSQVTCRILSVVLVCILAVGGQLRGAGLQIRDVCRLKGQEIRTLQGLGLVVGLKGTGSAEAKPTARALARMMQLMGGQMSLDPQGQLLLEDVEDAANVALVFVTARVPAVGAQVGDLLDCTVSAIDAKSLEGGQLMATPLLGPRADQPLVYALAEGPLTISDGSPPTVARLRLGARMQTTIQAPFQNNGVATLVLDPDIADFQTIQLIEDQINTYNNMIGSAPPDSSRKLLARAIDQLHLEVTIPEAERENPIMFLSLILNLRIDLPSNGNRVVINEREGVVVIGEDVRIAPALVTHKNLRIEATAENVLKPLDPESALTQADPNPKLKALADALNALDVPTADLIEIIKVLKAKGDLYGKVIFQ